MNSFWGLKDHESIQKKKAHQTSSQSDQLLNLLQTEKRQGTKVRNKYKAQEKKKKKKKKA